MPRAKTTLKSLLIAIGLIAYSLGMLRALRDPSFRTLKIVESVLVISLLFGFVAARFIPGRAGAFWFGYAAWGGTFYVYIHNTWQSAHIVSDIMSPLAMADPFRPLSTTPWPPSPRASDSRSSTRSTTTSSPSEMGLSGGPRMQLDELRNMAPRRSEGPGPETASPPMLSDLGPGWRTGATQLDVPRSEGFPPPGGVASRQEGGWNKIRDPSGSGRFVRKIGPSGGGMTL